MIAVRSYPLERRMWDQSRQVVRDYQPKTFEVRIAPSALNADFTEFANVDPGEPFLWTHICGFNRDPANPTHLVMGNALVTIRIGGPGGRATSRDPIHWLNLIGTTLQPHRNPTPYYLRNSTLHVTLRQLSGTLNTVFELQFKGMTVRRFKP